MSWRNHQVEVLEEASNECSMKKRETSTSVQRHPEHQEIGPKSAT